MLLNDWHLEAEMCSMCGSYRIC